MNLRMLNRIAPVALGTALTLAGCAMTPELVGAATNHLVLVPPAKLPEQAQQPGESLLLHTADDGRAYLYLEQSGGVGLAILDVTDPAHVTARGTVVFNQSAAFDFVLVLDERRELVRYRDGRGTAILDMRQPQSPTLTPVATGEAFTTTVTLTAAGYSVTALARDYTVVSTDRSTSGAWQITGVHAEVSRADTGTTFLLASDGLYEIRRPSLEIGRPVQVGSS